jgi:hypothetical protein
MSTTISELLRSLCGKETRTVYEAFVLARKRGYHVLSIFVHPSRIWFLRNNLSSLKQIICN